MIFLEKMMKLSKPAFPHNHAECRLFRNGRRLYMIHHGKSTSVFVRSLSLLQKYLPNQAFKRVAPTVNNALSVLDLYVMSKNNFIIEYQGKQWDADSFEKAFKHVATGVIDPFEGDPYEIPEEE